MSRSNRSSRGSTLLPLQGSASGEHAELSERPELLAVPPPANGCAREDEIWRNFHPPLVAFTRRHLGQTLARKLDPEEVVQSVFAMFFERVRQGRFVLGDHVSTWHLLERLASRQCHHCWKYFHAARRDIGREVESTGLATTVQPRREFAASDHQPADHLLLAEAMCRLLTQFSDQRHKAIIRLALHGCKSHEISLRTHHSRRGVQQVLQRARQFLLRMDRELE